MESSASAGRVASAVLDPRRGRALALLCGASFMVLLDGTITMVAVPSIGAGPRSARPASAQLPRPPGAHGRGVARAHASLHTRQLLPGHLRRAALCGGGIGLAFLTATVAALAGVAEQEAGLASGLSNTALQTGTALGVAIVTTLAVSVPSTTWQRTKARTRSPR